MKWFKHKSNSSERQFMVELEDKFGLEGYARWYKIIEKIADSMENENDCSSTYPLKKWQTFLKVKGKKLETFLEHLEKKQRIFRVLTGNLLEIKCPKIKEIRDNHFTNLQVTSKQLSLDTDKDKDTDKDTDKEKEYSEIAKEVISYLNRKRGKNFRNTKTNIGLISARLKDDYKKDQFIYVIDNKYKEWLGTEWEKYLIISTLFCLKHFDNYVNEKPFVKISQQKPETKLNNQLTDIKEWEENEANKKNIQSGFSGSINMRTEDRKGADRGLVGTG